LKLVVLFKMLGLANGGEVWVGRRVLVTGRKRLSICIIILDGLKLKPR